MSEDQEDALVAHASLILRFPRWPVDRVTSIFKDHPDGFQIEILAYPNGMLRFRIAEDTGAQFDFKTQPVNILTNVPVPIGCFWNDNVFAVVLFDRDLKPYEGNETEVITISERTTADLSHPISLDDTDARNACKAQMDWRAATYKPLRDEDVPDGRKKVTVDDQVRQLRDCLTALSRHVTRIHAGETFPAYEIATMLRSLVCWKYNRDGRLNQNYNPLLLRIAAYAGVPLPVYVDPSFRNIFDSFGTTDESMDLLTPSLSRTYPEQRLMDFQDWLATPVGAVSGIDLYAKKDLICDLASTTGIGHFDPTVSHLVNRLHSRTTDGFMQALNFIAEIGNLVVGLGTYVLDEFQRAVPSRDSEHLE